MAELTRPDLEELDRAIDAVIPGLRLLKRGQRVALLSLLGYFEHDVRSDVGRMHGGNVREALTRACAGLDFALMWIFRYSQPEDDAIRETDVSSETRASLNDEVREICELSQRYSDVWDVMSMLWRGILVGRKESDNATINLHFSSPLLKEMDMAGRIVAAPNKSSNLREEDQMRSVPSLIAKNVQPQIRSDKSITYEIPSEIFDFAANATMSTTKDKWEMDPSWKLGGYTIGDFHRFWISLQTLSGIHSLISLPLIARTTRESMIKVMPRPQWEDEMVKRSGLGSTTVSAILQDLTYDPSLYVATGNRPLAIYQPFIPVQPDLLAVSPLLVDTAVAERNIWHLISIIRPRTHDDLKNQKESLWVRELSARLEGYGFRVHSTIPFTHNGRSSDLDMLILHAETRFGLVCELKWLIPPGSIKQGTYNDEEFRKGVTQAIRACDWARSGPQDLSRHIKIETNEIMQYDLRPIVLSKNALPSAWLREPGVPIISERLLDWILDEPHRRDVETLWRVGEELRYLPVKGKHFEDREGCLDFGEFRFKGEPIGFVLTEPWNPRTDIDLSDLPAPTR